MDRRGTIGAKPGARTEETNRSSPATSRLAGSSRTTTASPNSTRSSALSTRTTGSTISKPPTRPTATSARKAISRSSEESVRDVGENKRPTRTPITTSLSSRTPRQDGTTVRRTTLGGSTASAPPRRPLPTPSRTATSTDSSRSRTSTVSTSRTAKSPAVESQSSNGASRPLSRDAIPEEPESDLPSGFVYAADAPNSTKSPPKLEIRSINISTPRLKPRAESDAEVEIRKPRLETGHVRAQSAFIGQSHGVQEKQVMQNMLRESAVRDTMTAELERLRAEVQRLTAENVTLHQAATTASRMSSQESTEATQEDVEQLKASHQTAITALESTHSAELEKIHAEIERHRTQSTKLEGVESKIKAVEEALRDSKARASKNEQELQQTIQAKDEDREQLGRVIDDLKVEIDRCQKQLDADVAKEAQEKQQAVREMEQLREELAEERRRNAETVAGIEKEKSELQSEIDKLQEQTTTVNGAHTSELKSTREQAQQQESVANDLRSELEKLQEQRDLELQRSEEANGDLRSVVKDLQEQLAKLQQDDHDGTRVIEDLQNQLQQHQQSQQDIASTHDAETQGLREVIEGLQTDNARQQQTHQDAIAQKDKAAESLNAVITDLQERSARLEQSLEDARVSKSETVTRLSETIQQLREETAAHKERYEEDASAKEKENADLNRVILELQEELNETRTVAGEARRNAEVESSHMGGVVCGLQDEVQALQHQIHDAKSERQSALADLQELKDRHEVTGKQLEGIQAETEMLRQQQSSHRVDVLSKEDKIEELQTLLADAENAKSNAQKSLESLQDEMRGLQRVVESIEQDAADKDRRHSLELVKVRKELIATHETQVQDLKDDHAEAVTALQQSLSSQNATSTEESQEKFESLMQEKRDLEKRFGEVEIRHNRELEEETQKHEAAYQDLQKVLKQAKESQTRHADAQVKKHEEQYRELHESLTALKKSHDEAMEQLTAEHEHKVQGIMAKHVAQIAEVEEEAAQRAEAAGVARDRIHGARLAALEVEHAEALAKATGGSCYPTSDAPLVENLKTSPRGLSHVFVNHAKIRHGSGQHVRNRLSETPLAYASEDDELASPTPVPRKPDSKEDTLVTKVKSLEEENVMLSTALKAAEAKLAAFEQGKAEAAHPIATGSPSMSSESPVHVTATATEDLFAPKAGVLPKSDPHTAHAPATPKKAGWSGHPSLTGMLASLQVQAAQLIEVSDDMATEQQRHLSDLSARRSKHSSPLKAAS
ncbi:hypothetical protein BDY17DRAFT_322313 [Neohortaea acidophila]|uniref:Uncharacterized protein n=1 Tax=Neohortaea acidophila TaxID=245834 RepID=A0A6A6PZM0_9PEZI|nr:uncharacterized protein BDY17DRAFT_322313 [Neohortaea acidophila]KAF2485475.1 hypothetical protein BDY17DRAFT_322313 [Neohortaea acidophila]